MALSGSMSTNNYDGRYYKLSWEATQSIPNNTSTLSWKLEALGGDDSWYAERTVKVVINGTTVWSKSKDNRVERYKGTVKTGTITIAHNADGTKSFGASLQVACYTASVNLTASKTFALDTIARASQPSLVTWPETTNNVGNFGVEFAIHMNRASDVFTHTVRYEFGSRKGTIATGVGTGTTWAVPLDFMNDIPNSTSGSGRIYVDTYNGSTLIGTKYTGFTATVPTSVKPTCSITLEDTTGIDDIYGSPVKGLSKIKVTVGAKTAYSSPIAAYTITANGATYSAAEITTDVLKTSGTSRVTVTVKDARGRTGTTYYDMTVLNYTFPVISKLAVRRCDQDGGENDQGDYSQVTISAAITSLSKKNTASYVLKYKKSSSSTWTSVTLSGLANTYTVTDYTYIFPADGNSSYDVELTATDRHDSAIRSTSLSTAFTLLNWGSDGTSMGVGKVAEEANTLSIALTTEQLGNRYAASSPGVAGSTGFVLMAQVQVIAANADTPITFVFSRRQEVAPMTVHLQLKNSTAESSSLVSFRYEGANYDVYAYAPDALTWNIYVLKGSNYDTITLQDWYTSKSMNSRVKVTFPGSLVDTVPTPYYKATPAQLQSILDFIYPVGSVYITYSHNDPAQLFGGTWTRIQNAFLWAVDADGAIGQTGGSKTHTLTVDELPSHSHGSVYSQHATGTKDKAWYNTSGSSVAYGTVATGGGAAHNNMPPYIQVSVWRRTA